MYFWANFHRHFNKLDDNVPHFAIQGVPPGTPSIDIGRSVHGKKLKIRKKYTDVNWGHSRKVC